VGAGRLVRQAGRQTGRQAGRDAGRQAGRGTTIIFSTTLGTSRLYQDRDLWAKDLINGEIDFIIPKRNNEWIWISRSKEWISFFKEWISRSIFNVN
jgi:hypothetical protein